MLLQLRVLQQHGWEGRKAAVGGYWGVVVKDPTMCCLYWNGEQWMMWWMNGDAVPPKDFCALDEMNAFQLWMVMDDPFIMSLHRSADDLLFSWVIHPCHLCSSWSPWWYQWWVSFLFLPFPFCTGVFLPPRYLWPIRTLESCFALTWKSSHASFAIPIKKYFLLSLSHTATAKILVGPFFGSCLKHAAFVSG